MHPIELGYAIGTSDSQEPFQPRKQSEDEEDISRWVHAVVMLDIAAEDFYEQRKPSNG
jgi:hypothetical protein